jgi:hypothetical protein
MILSKHVLFPGAAHKEERYAFITHWGAIWTFREAIHNG